MNYVGVITLILGLSASASITKSPARLTQIDCQLLFPGANSSETIQALESGIQCTEAWEQGAWGPPEEFLGYVFLKCRQHQGKEIKLLVGMTNTGAITRVRVKGIDGVDEKFLAQFRGKTLQDNFDLAHKPEDLLVIPIKIKPMQGKLELSESITNDIGEIVLSADKMLR